MHSPEIFTAANGVFAIAIGIFSIWKFPYNPINRIFSFIAFTFAIWSGARFLPIEKEFTELIALGAATLAAVANFHFIKNLIGKSSHKLILPIIYLANLVLFALLSVDRLGFFEILAISEIWFAGFLTTLVLPIFLITKSINLFSGAKKYQLVFVVLEFFMALGVVSCSLFYFWDLEKSLIENIATSPHLLSGLHLFAVFYFFVQWKFLKLKIIAPKILKRAVALTITLAATLIISTGNNTFEISHNVIINQVANIVIAILIYTLILRFFAKQNWFTTLTLNNFERVVEDFKNQNIFYASIEDLEKNTKQSFSQRIGIQEAQVVVLDLEGGKSQYPELEKYFLRTSHYLVTSEEEYLAKNKHIDCPYLSELQKLGDVCFPLFQNTNELIGFFTIRHTDNDIYIEEELELLEGGVHYIALSLVAILYTEKLQQQAKKLREDYERLKTLDNAKDAFIANVSHELRTPATAIKGYAEMLVAPNFGKLNEKQTNFTKRISKNTNWLLKLLADILEITKIESGQIGFRLEKVDARNLLEGLSDKWLTACRQKNLNFDIELAEGIKTEVETDIKKLDEIIERLIGNAHKFTEKGGIKIVARNQAEFLEIGVVDTGIGIAPEKIDQIWDKFSQSANFLEKGDEGSGLGLAIVKKLVENLNGKIFIKSTLGQGSTFTLLIPRNNG